MCHASVVQRRGGTKASASDAGRAGTTSSSGWAADAAIAVALGLVAWIVRRTGLPHDGLWHDDRVGCDRRGPRTRH